ncbi:tripartite tricarboxylate transporter TctB family protein [Moorella mulderi DSM 14980]|uniref:Tripartite tricarboxylate transporter TctB family protein n=2 Tax=Neomoorella TaxID=44260 RepID=A0A151ASK0_9FIRM|nr:tripartite tricarboxylate transporter TctB family protein [Moorella mulderi DSM 14980]
MQEIYFTGFILLVSIIYTFNALTLRIGNTHAPGPGFLPLGIGLGAIIMALIVLVNSILEMKKERINEGANQKQDITEPFNAKRVILFVLGVAVYIAIMETAGFLIASFCLMFYLFRVMGIGGWAKQIIYALLSSGIAYIIFALWLNVPFPQGFLR